MPTLRTFVIFSLIGPPIGAIVYGIGLFIGDAKPGQPLSAFADAMLVLSFSAPFSYVFGLIPALLAALLMVAGSSLLSIRPGPLYAVAVGLICGIIFALVFLPGADDSGLGVSGFFVLKVLTCLVPSLICWWLARPKRADASEAGNEAVQK